ncbi:MAG: PA domain-containing protein [Ignavibacteriaceae bacterium]
MKPFNILTVYLLSIFLSIIIISESFSQTGTIIVNKLTNPSTSGLDFNFVTSPTLKINSPVVYNFMAGSAQFGPALDQTGVTGILELVYGEGCNAADFAGFVAGNIAVIDRGTCSFTDKVVNAQNAGAIGVIIINNPGGAVFGLGGEDPFITIPSVSVSYNDGQIIKLESGFGLNATMNKELEDFTLQNGGTKILNNVPAGIYSIGEEAQLFEGIELSDILISDPSGGSSSQLNFRKVFINLAAGETVEVTFISDITIIENLLTDVEDLLLNGVLNSGQANALTVKLQNTKNKVDEGQISAALNLLNAFINQVSDFIQNGLLTPSQGQSLIDQAEDLIDLITGSLPKISGDDILGDFALLQNYPNPFNPSTTISWQSPVDSWQTLKIYDLLGREIATLVDEYKPAGTYEVEFDAGNLASGTYFYRLSAGSFTETRKLLLMK